MSHFKATVKEISDKPDAPASVLLELYDGVQKIEGKGVFIHLRPRTSPKEAEELANMLNKFGATVSVL